MTPRTLPQDPLTLRLACVSPDLRLADVRANAAAIAAAIARCDSEGVDIVLFPELSLTGYSLDDLHLSSALLDAARDGILQVLEETRDRSVLASFGAPIECDGRVFNCAVIIAGGRILGVVPKTYLPNYREYYEKRQFASARDRIGDSIRIGDCDVPFGTGLLFCAQDRPGCVIAAEICEDMWAPAPPSTLAALAGATVLLNLSASSITIGKADQRDRLCASQSARTIAAYAYAAAGYGESTTDLAWDGQAAIYELGETLAQCERFGTRETLTLADIDLERIRQERIRNGTFRDCARDADDKVRTFRRVEFVLGPSRRNDKLLRPLARYPFVPDDPARRDYDCYEAYNIQVQGLQRRLQATGARRVVIGVSGGLDSTQALLVAARVMDLTKRPRTDVLAVTLPGYATSEETRTNAVDLISAIGAECRTIDIRPLCDQMFRDIGHPFASGRPVYDTVFENVQAGMRTDLLFRLANQESGFVLGTGDLSELALGWCTYGVGDHMSHYNVNSGVPKTLIRHLIEWSAASGLYSETTAATLRRISATEISPELIPPSAGGAIQSTQAAIGPYDLHDFFLFHMLRYGYGPIKLYRLAAAAWGEGSPCALAGSASYTPDEIVRWLEVFIRRFFASQFKRSAAPNGPKVASGGALSPRGDWRAPSDASAAAWLAEIDTLRAAFSR